LKYRLSATGKEQKDLNTFHVEIQTNWEHNFYIFNFKVTFWGNTILLLLLKLITISTQKVIKYEWETKLKRRKNSTRQIILWTDHIVAMLCTRANKKKPYRGNICSTVNNFVDWPHSGAVMHYSRCVEPHVGAMSVLLSSQQEAVVCVLCIQKESHCFEG
jgi:hypothetical protein